MPLGPQDTLQGSGGPRQTSMSYFVLRVRLAVCHMRTDTWPSLEPSFLPSFLSFSLSHPPPAQIVNHKLTPAASKSAFDLTSSFVLLLFLSFFLSSCWGERERKEKFRISKHPSRPPLRGGRGDRRRSLRRGDQSLSAAAKGGLTWGSRKVYLYIYIYIFIYLCLYLYLHTYIRKPCEALRSWLGSEGGPGHPSIHPSHQPINQSINHAMDLMERSLSPLCHELVN